MTLDCPAIRGSLQKGPVSGPVILMRLKNKIISGLFTVIKPDIRDEFMIQLDQQTDCGTAEDVQTKSVPYCNRI